jgi:hypothetical protein
LEEQERPLVLRAMEVASGNQSEAARILRIGRYALRFKLKSTTSASPAETVETNESGSRRRLLLQGADISDHVIYRFSGDAGYGPHLTFSVRDDFFELVVALRLYFRRP